MTRFPAAYAKSILADTGCEAADVDDIEDIMRAASGGTLDHLNRRAFRKLARDAHAALPEYRAAIGGAS